MTKQFRRGFALLFTLILMATLSVLVSSLVLYIRNQMSEAGTQADDYQLLSLSEAGVARACLAIREDYLTSIQTGSADLRGSAYSNSINVTNPQNMRYINEGSAAIIDNNADQAIMTGFDITYINSRLITTQMCVRAARGAGNGASATMTASYTLDGTTYTSLSPTYTLSDGTYRYYYWTISGLNWTTIRSANFRLRVQRTAGTRQINVDSIFLRASYEIDTLTEPWATGSYATFPITLGSGNIQSIVITDEQGKAHINTASQALLRYLLLECGAAATTANTLATRIVTYRNTKYFDSVEELQKVTGMTSAPSGSTITYYNMIKDYVTVYSFIDLYAQRAAAARAPVNINTAPRQVLEAIFDGITGMSTANSATLAGQVISSRPFTCFYSSDTAVTTDFYDFVLARSYLSATLRRYVLDNADPNALVPVSGAAAYNCATTEFTYDSGVFNINSLSSANNRTFRVITIFGQNGSHTFTTNKDDTTPVGYRRESYG